MHVGQSSIDAIMAVNQLEVVDAQEMQNGCMDVVTIGRLERFVGPFVARTVSDAALDATAGEPVRERERIVVAALAALAAGHPAEFGRPQNDRVVEQPARFQILDERRRRLVHAARPCRGGLWRGSSWLSQLRRGKPLSAPLQSLHETHAALEQPPRDQAARAEVLE